MRILNVQFSADIFFQLTQKNLSRYVAAFRDAFIAPVAIAMTIKKYIYLYCAALHYIQTEVTIK